MRSGAYNQEKFTKAEGTSKAILVGVFMIFNVKAFFCFCAISSGLCCAVVLIAQAFGELGGVQFQLGHRCKFSAQ